MLIDCDACAVRGPACGDCVVSVLLAGPAGHVHDGEPPGAPGSGPSPDLDAAERAAIAVLAGSGLVRSRRVSGRSRKNALNADQGGSVGLVGAIVGD